MLSKNHVEEGSTIVSSACSKVAGFPELYNRLERKISLSGKSKSTFSNYGRHMAHLALHFNCLPTDLDKEQIDEYLFYPKGNLPTYPIIKAKVMI